MGICYHATTRHAVPTGAFPYSKHAYTGLRQLRVCVSESDDEEYEEAIAAFGGVVVLRQDECSASRAEPLKPLYAVGSQRHHLCSLVLREHECSTSEQCLPCRWCHSRTGCLCGSSVTAFNSSSVGFPHSTAAQLPHGDALAEHVLSTPDDNQRDVRPRVGPGPRSQDEDMVSNSHVTSLADPDIESIVKSLLTKSEMELSQPHMKLINKNLMANLRQCLPRRWVHNKTGCFCGRGCFDCHSSPEGERPCKLKEHNETLSFCELCPPDDEDAKHKAATGCLPCEVSMPHEAPSPVPIRQHLVSL